MSTFLYYENLIILSNQMGLIKTFFKKINLKNQFYVLI